MRWQPDPVDSDTAWPPQLSPIVPRQADEPGGPEFRPDPPASRRRIRAVAFVTLLIAGLGGLGFAAVGAAHQLLPRRFTLAQQQKIATWEMTSRWRSLTAGKIFPAVVSYQLPGSTFNTGNLKLLARRVTIGSSTICAPALSTTAAGILNQHGCEAVLRATYVDGSGSLVATVGVAVLSDSAQALASVKALGHHASAEPLRVLKAPGTLAAGFRDRQRQLSQVAAAGPYVIMSTAGFTDARPAVQIFADRYLAHELTSLAGGLSKSASQRLGRQPPVPTCPGAPGC